MSRALADRDLQAARTAWSAILKSFGNQAGEPEEPDSFTAVPADFAPLTPAERPKAYGIALKYLQKMRWWRIGLDPVRTEHALREVSDAIRGLLAARRAGSEHPDLLLAEAKAAGDFLLWAQESAGTGVFPFPAVRGGRSRAFQVAERFLAQAEAAGKAALIATNGWLIDDLGRGDLQFDNGLCGVALFDLHEACGEEKYRKAALAAAEWALRRPAVPNVNYNTFTTFLLCRAFRATGEVKYLESAKERMRLSVYPGQVLEGPRAGRWADAHNAKPVYHYIIVRGLASLLSALPPEDADRPQALASLRAALIARNHDFVEKGICNKSSAFEALLLVKMLPGLPEMDLAGCFVEEALSALERMAVGEIRSGRGGVGPLEWGFYLEFLSRRGRG
ncbi:MAG: hypothetical protein J0L75_08110 [Spirochaetes bacterium]|nr:hypothetical protein [Spirochaetota bacterium]